MRMRSICGTILRVTEAACGLGACTQAAQRKALDVLNTVGLGDALLKLAERRQRGDMYIAYGGMVRAVCSAPREALLACCTGASTASDFSWQCAAGSIRAWPQPTRDGPCVPASACSLIPHRLSAYHAAAAAPGCSWLQVAILLFTALLVWWAWF